MATTYPPSEKMLAFIHVLLKERQVPVAGKSRAEAKLIARCEDVMGEKPITWGEAKDVIAYLKAQPKKAPSGGPGPSLNDVPVSKYALVGQDGVLRFYEVVQRKSGMRYVNQLVGHPGDWKRVYLSKAAAAKIAAQIAADPKSAAQTFGYNFTVCGKCSSPLSDPESIALGIGPVCKNAF